MNSPWDFPPGVPEAGADEPSGTQRTVQMIILLTLLAAVIVALLLYALGAIPQ
jgi:hypothetical protein